METCKVRILGSDYSVRTDSDAGHVERVARRVDEYMRRIEEQYRPGSTTRTAVLACMNIVDEQFRREQPDDDWLTTRVGTLIEKLASGIGRPVHEREAREPGSAPGA
ncbi:MAG: cell division protein ZapA [bacterium]